MSKTSKTFLFYVVVPMLLAFLNSSLSSYKNFMWGYDHINEISITALIVSILGAIYTLYLNKVSESKKMAWYIVPILWIIFALYYIYVINSFSHFGF